MARLMSIPVLAPADVQIDPSRTKMASRSTAQPGTSSASRSQAAQWVAQRRPSSSPAAPRMKAPEHTEATRLARPAAR